MHVEVEKQKQEETERARVLVEKRRKQVQQCAVKLFKQIKMGCNKDLCFNQYCKKNPHCKAEMIKFKDDKAILLHLTKVLFNTSDPEDLICSDSNSINISNIESFSDD
jgi:hypothetical protein